MSRNIARTAARGGLGTFGGNLLGFLGRFLLNMALARLIAPESFGLYAIMVGVAGAAAIPALFAFSQGILQLEAMPGLFRSAFRWTMVVHVAALVMTLVAAAIAQEVASPESALLLAGIAIGKFLDGPAACLNSQLYRDTRYKRVVVHNLAGVAISSGAALYVAAVVGGPIALVVRDVLARVVTIIMGAHALRHSSDVRERPTKATHKRVLGLGTQLFLNRFIEMGYQTFHTLFVGAIVGERMMGFYVQALYISGLPMTFVQPVLSTVVLRTLKQLSGDADRTAHAVRIVDFLMLAGGLVFAIGAVVAPDLATIIVLGPNWDTSAVILPSMCVVVAVYPLVMSRLTLLTSEERWFPLRLASFLALVALAAVFPLGWFLGGVPYAGFGVSAAVLATFLVATRATGGVRFGPTASALLAAAMACAAGIAVRMLIPAGLLGGTVGCVVALVVFVFLLLVLQGRQVKRQLAYLKGVVARPPSSR